MASTKLVARKQPVTNETDHGVFSNGKKQEDPPRPLSSFPKKGNANTPMLSGKYLSRSAMMPLAGNHSRCRIRTVTWTGPCSDILW